MNPFRDNAVLQNVAGDQINPATQDTLAEILAKIIAAPATAAHQVTAQTSLTAIAAALGAPGDAAGANTVIGQLKQIAENTTPA